jgi:hypothetical protein
LRRSLGSWRSAASIAVATNEACSTRASLAERSRWLSVAAMVSEIVGSRTTRARKRSRGICKTVLGPSARIVAERGSPVKSAISPKRSPGVSVPTRSALRPSADATKTPSVPAATT